MANYVYEIGLNQDGTTRTVTFDGREYTTGQSFEAENVCEMVRFLRAFPGNPRELRSGSFQAIEEESARPENNCPISFASDDSIQPQQAPFNPPVDSNPGPNGSDTYIQQGSPQVQAGGSLGQNNTGETGDGTNPNTVFTEESLRPPEGDPHPTRGGEQPQEQTNAGDPVDIFSGSFYLQETDLAIPNTILPLSFTRFYRSGDASFGPLGWNWDHNFNLFIRELRTGDIALWRNLHEDIFKFDGVNFEPPRGVFEKLERVPAIAQVYEITGKFGVVMHFERPVGWVDGERIPLLWIRDQHGNALQFSYGTEDKLTEVRDDDDRFFQFDYDQCGLLVAVSDHALRKFQYEHDEYTMQLTCVKSPVISDHPDGITKIYHYEQQWALPELRQNIIRVEDSDGNVYLENTYDQEPSSWSYARITEQLYGGFLYQFQYTQLQWVPANPLYINIPALRVEVMNPDFGLETYTFNYRGDLLDRRYRLNKDKSYRVIVWQYEFDEQGNPSKTTSPDGSEEISILDFANPDPIMRNNLLQKEITSSSGFPSPSRIVWRGEYEPSYQQLIEERNETGAAITYKYDFDITPGALTNTGKLIEKIQPDTTLPDGSIQQAKTIFEYNSKGQLITIVLPDGTRNEFKYGIEDDKKSRLIKQVFDAGILNIEHKIEYDSFGYHTETIDGNGNSTRQIFNALGLPEKSILADVNGLPTEHILHYDSDKKIISSERPKGTYANPLDTGSHIHDKFERDVLGYPTKYILSSNTSEARILRICNDYRGHPIETINPDGSIIRKTYDERGLPLSEEVIGTDGKKITSKKVYNRSGKLIRETSPIGLTTIYEHDGFSRISKVLFQNGTEIRNQWLRNDLLGSEETIGDDGTGSFRQLSFKSYTYDEKNRRITETVKVFTDNPAVSTNTTNTYFYDNLDRVIRIINNRDGVSRKQYDGLGRVITETDSMGNEEYHTYDNNGNLIQTDSHHVEPDSSVSVITKQYNYDERNRRIEMIEPDGAKIISEYDDRNLLVRQTDYLGIVKETFYNSYNNKIKEIQDTGGLNITSHWTIDNMSRITSYTDPTGQISNYTFDSVGRILTIDYPNGFSSTKTFNEANQIIRERLGSGVEFEYTYDSSNRILKIENIACPAAIKEVDQHVFSYDGLDRVISATVGTDTVFRRYDSQSRLLSETTLGNTISCSYNDASGEVEKIWPDGRTEKLSHDLNGILSKIEETINGSLGSGNELLAAFKTSGPTFFGQAEYQGGLTITNLYDERKRLTEINIQSPSGTQEDVEYRYNKSNTKQVEALIGQNSKTSYFEFDSRYRLLNSKDSFPAVIPAASTQAEHDIAINQIQISAIAAQHAEEFEYNTSDARTKYSESGNPDKNYLFFPGHEIQHDDTNAYIYHREGTLKNDGLFEYETDAFGRVVTIKEGVNIVTEISYDAFGRPSTINEAGKPDRSLNYLGGFVAQENENGIASRQITIQPVTGVPIAYHSTAGTHYTLFDSGFNLIGFLDINGNLLETYRYKSFGLPQVYDNTGALLTTSAFSTEPIFGGQKYLSASGLYLSKRRLMNPVNGVFLSADPNGYVDSSSLYVYAKQNPVNCIDPFGGLVWFIPVIVIGSEIVGVGLTAIDASENPGEYEGSEGFWKTLRNAIGSAAVGGASIVGGEAVLAAGGTGIFAAEGSAITLTATQTFVLYGTSSAVSGSVARGGLNTMFPEHIDPATPGTIAMDYASGGGLGLAFNSLGLLSAPVTSGVRSSAFPTPRIVANGALGGSNGITDYGLTLGPETGWLGRIGLQRPIFNPTVDVIANPVGSTFTNVVRHEMRHASDMINYPQFSYLGTHSRLPGRGIAAFIMESRGYYAEFGFKGLLPNYAWRSLTNRVVGPITERHYLIGETLGLAGLAAFGLNLYDSDSTNQSHPNVKPPSSK